MSVHGYLDPWSARGGETVSVYVSDESAGSFDAALVRIGYPDHHPQGPGFEEEIVACPGSGSYPGRAQMAHAGSFAYAPKVEGLAGTRVVSLGLTIWPTLLRGRRQVLLAFGSPDSGPAVSLCLTEDSGLGLLVRSGGSAIWAASTGLVLERVWYRVHASMDLITGRFTAGIEPLGSAWTSSHPPIAVPPREESSESHVGGLGLELSGTQRVTVGAGWEAGRRDVPVPADRFDGKIESPWIAAGWFAAAPAPGPELLALWDFAAELKSGRGASRSITDISGHQAHGLTVNRPTRAVTGALWDGSVHSWQQAPTQYAALHCHSDDLDDAGWVADLELSLPPELESGMYAVRLTSATSSDRIPLFVRRPPSAGPKRLLFLIPTATYLAYANSRRVTDADLAELYFGRTRVLNRSEMVLADHREYGLCLYDTHEDGSGVCFSTRRRPILNQRPGESAWDSFGLACHIADLRLNAWARSRGIEWDIASDEDLHREGPDLLRPYRTVVTGSHPEYVSTRMLDAIRDYVGGGGRLAYLGGNGFCHRVAFDPDSMATVEVRRWGGADWQAAPGEHFLSVSGELGGMWRSLGRPPHELAGCGYIAEGFDSCSHFRRSADSFDSRAEWIFEGIGPDELIGDFGLVGEGAAGLELDAYDPSLGSPKEALVLASSEDHTLTYMLTDGTLPNPASSGAESPRVRADIVYYVTPANGAVFSVGSIAWCGSLWSNGGHNNVAQITENVLRRFAAERPLPW